jgi:Delta24-sterol reductase
MSTSLVSALKSLPAPTLADLSDIIELIKQWAISHPLAAAAVVSALYCFGMCFYRCGVETKTVTAPPEPKGWDAHNKDVEMVRQQFANYLKHRKPGQLVSLNRSRGGIADSNRTIHPLYKETTLKVDVSVLDGLIAIDKKRNLLHVEPGMPQDHLARISTAHGYVPHLVLEFPGITAGGAVCGGGIESTSHKHGTFLDTVEECDVITGDGRYLTNVSRTNHADLFWGLGASFGTMGILTRLAIRIEKAPKYVLVKYLHATCAEEAMIMMEAISDNDRAKGGLAGAPDFIDGVALGPRSAIAVIGQGVEAVPKGVPMVSLRGKRSDPWFFWHLAGIARTSKAIDSKVFAKEIIAANPSNPSSQKDTMILPPSILARTECMSLDDYLFRFDRGAFWMARHGLQVFYGNGAWTPGKNDAPTNPPSQEVVDAATAANRKVHTIPPAYASERERGASAGPCWPLRVKYSWLATTRQLYRMLHQVGDGVLARTYLVQDLIMPSSKAAAELIEFTTAAPIGIWPLWLCPMRQIEDRHPSNAGFGYPIQATKKGDLWFNVGVYGLPNGGRPFDPVKVNRSLEDKTTELEGRKMLYAQSFYKDEETFWSLFDKAAYDRVRNAYADGKNVFPDVSTKLLMGKKRMESLEGVLTPNLLAAWKPMVSWYLSLWGEMLLPRWLHPTFNIHHTGMVEWSTAGSKDDGEGEHGAPASAKLASPPKSASKAVRARSPAAASSGKKTR